MILYRLLQPVLVSLFGAAVFVLKCTPGARDKAAKLIETWTMRKVEGRPAFYAVAKETFKGQRPLWIHAASGEFEYAKPVIREIRARDGDVPILVTYFSPTYAENVRKFPGVTASCPLPLDSRGELEQFLNFLNPKALLIARTDAWPNTVAATNARRIPTLLFSTTFHERSKRMGSFARNLTRETLKNIDLIQCVSPDDKKTLDSLGLSNVEVAGDTRYDQVLARLSGVKPPTVLATTSAIKETLRTRSFIAGSVWHEDLKHVVESSFKTQNAAPHTLIVVPHEIHESFLREIETAAVESGFRKDKVTRLSRISHASQPLDVLIVDSVGLLAELYLLSDIAFVGGSFRKTVHSVMEPLAAGCLTIVGPFHTNNREAIEFQALHSKSGSHSVADIPFVTAVRDTNEMTKTLTTLWKVSAQHDFKSEIQTEVAKRGGATARVLRWLKL